MKPQQSREPKNSPQVCLIDFLQEWESNSMKERQTFKQTVLDQLDFPGLGGCPQPKFHTVYKINSK